MTRIVVDPVLRTKLRDLSAQAELCDEDGRTVGHYLPAEVYQQLLYASLPVPFSQEEIARRRQQKGGRGLAEIWKSLGRA